MQPTPYRFRDKIFDDNDVDGTIPIYDVITNLVILQLLQIKNNPVVLIKT